MGESGCTGGASGSWVSASMAGAAVTCPGAPSPLHPTAPGTPPCSCLQRGQSRICRCQRGQSHSPPSNLGSKGAPQAPGPVSSLGPGRLWDSCHQQGASRDSAFRVGPNPGTLHMAGHNPGQYRGIEGATGQPRGLGELPGGGNPDFTRASARLRHPWGHYHVGPRGSSRRPGA